MIYPKSLWEMTVLLAAYQEEYGKAVDKLEDEMEAIYDAAHKEAEKLSEAYKKKLAAAESGSNLHKMMKKVEEIQKEMEIILGGAPDLAAMGIELGSDESVSTKGLDTIDPLDSLSDAMAKLNAALRDLASIDLEAMTPPETIERFGSGKEAGFTIHGGTNAGTYTLNEPLSYHDRGPDGIAGAACVVWGLCQEVLERSGVLQSKVAEACDAGDFSLYLEDCASEWCGERRKEKTVALDALYAELYDGGARAIDPAFFAYYDSARDEACDTYLNHPFEGFRDRIDLGYSQFMMADDYASFSHLTEHITRGYYDVPLLLDLKKLGNLFIFPQSEQYSDRIAPFVNQVILQFLGAAPVGKMKLCLVDVDNRFSFSPYKVLDKVDPSILFKGIIRDDRLLADTIKDMEQIMYRISDDVLSYNGVEDIFEYNAKFTDNQEALHLLVIANEQAITSDDLRRRLQNIMLHGNRCGIYTLVVSPQGCCSHSLESFHDKELTGAYNALLEAVIDTTVAVDFADNIWTTSAVPSLADFTPACETAGKDKVSISRLPSLIEIMLEAKK